MWILQSVWKFFFKSQRFRSFSENLSHLYMLTIITLLLCNVFAQWIKIFYACPFIVSLVTSCLFLLLTPTTKVPSLELCLFKFHYIFPSLQLSAICLKLKFNANFVSSNKIQAFRKGNLFLKKLLKMLGIFLFVESLSNFLRKSRSRLERLKCSGWIFEVQR